MIRTLIAKCASPVRYIENQVQNIRTIKAIYEAMPLISATKFENLTEGAHVMLSNSAEDHEHAIITGIDRNAQAVTVIRCICKDINTPNSETEIKEETFVFNKNKEVFVVNYNGNAKKESALNLTRMPEKVSVEVARHFKENSKDFQHPKLVKDCEHFAFCCTLGYPINNHEMNLLMIAFGALKVFDKNFMPDMNEFMLSEDLLAQYDKINRKLKMTSTNGEVTNIQVA